MLDARNIYRKVTRKIYDFAPEQLQNLTAIVWLHRGQSDRFLALVQNYLDRTLTEAAAIADQAVAFRKAYDALAEAAVPFLSEVGRDRRARRAPDGRPGGPSLPDDKADALEVLVKERDDVAKACFDGLEKWTGRIASEWSKPERDGYDKSKPPKLAAQKKLLAELDALATACRDLVKDVDLVCKLATRVTDQVNDLASDESVVAVYDRRLAGKLVKELDARRKDVVEQLKRTAYFQRQAHWLLSRFPEARFTAVPGLCKVVTRAEIEAADWSLTPGRYVGVAPPEVDEDFDFEQSMRDIHIELADLNKEAAELAGKIQENFEGLGI